MPLPVAALLFRVLCHGEQSHVRVAHQLLPESLGASLVAPLCIDTAAKRVQRGEGRVGPGLLVVGGGVGLWGTPFIGRWPLRDQAARLMGPG